MTNREIAAVLFNISTILSMQNGNPYRIRAYRRAARNLLRIREPIAQRVAAGKPLGLPRLGQEPDCEDQHAGQQRCATVLRRAVRRAAVGGARAAQTQGARPRPDNRRAHTP